MSEREQERMARAVWATLHPPRQRTFWGRARLFLWAVGYVTLAALLGLPAAIQWHVERLLWRPRR